MRYDIPEEHPYDEMPRKSNATALVLISALFTVVIILVVFIVLLSTNVITFNDDNQDDFLTEDLAVSDSQSTPTQTPIPTATQVVYQPVPVNKTMYIGNCKSSVTLRVGPGTNFDEIRQIPYGEAIYVLEYTTNDFAQVDYAGNRGYVMRDYIVSVQPQFYTYYEEDVEAFVESSLYAFVNGITNKDNSYVYTYFSGNAVNTELSSYNSISAVVDREVLHYVNCHSVTRISPSRVTVVRDSTIEVFYKDGRVKSIPEKYIYTVDISVSPMKIVDITAAKQ